MNKKSLSCLSYDSTNNIYVCDYDNEFIDLDNFKGSLKKEQVPNTPDMLYIDDDKKEIWFVEFKSSELRNLDKIQEKIKLRKKIFAGLFLMYELFCENCCDYKDYSKFYFIVYNKEYSFLSYEDEVLELFNVTSERSIEFGLEDLKPQFVKDIFTENCKSLKKLFEVRFNIKFTKENNG